MSVLYWLGPDTDHAYRGWVAYRCTLVDNTGNIDNDMEKTDAGVGNIDGYMASIEGGMGKKPKQKGPAVCTLTTFVLTIVGIVFVGLAVSVVVSLYAARTDSGKWVGGADVLLLLILTLASLSFRSGRKCRRTNAPSEVNIK